MCLLELKNMSYRHQGAQEDILMGVNAGFEPGKAYAVMGKPGSGKTTLLALLAGLDACSGGEVRYGGRNLNDIDRDGYRAKCLGVVFRSCNLIANTTAVENVVLSMNIGGDVSKDSKAKAYTLLQNAGIGHETADKSVSRLSAGERQRVAVARALANDPGIILADEPTGDLSAEDGSEVLDMLISLAHASGKCVILATQSKKAASAADELWALANGKMLLVR